MPLFYIGSELITGFEDERAKAQAERRAAGKNSADEGSSRKRRNRELEEATLGATLSDHVSNGERAKAQAERRAAGKNSPEDCF